MKLIPGREYNITITADDPGFAEANITIINTQSYPRVGGKWEVRFTTEGTANSTIKAVNGTTLSNVNDDNDLKFLEVKCGNDVLNYSWINNSVFIQDYECNETGYETSKVLTSGKHTLQFRFGDDTAYANNFAGHNRYRVQPIPLTSFGTSTTLDVTIDSVNRNHSFIVKTQTSSSMGESTCNDADESIISVRFTSDTNIRFERGTNVCTPDVTAYVVEALDNQFTVYNTSL